MVHRTTSRALRLNVIKMQTVCCCHMNTEDNAAIGQRTAHTWRAALLLRPREALSVTLHTSTGLLYGRTQYCTGILPTRRTSVCGPRLILTCHAGSCHIRRTNGYTLALQVVDWAWSYHPRITKCNQWRTEGGLGGSNPPEIPKLGQIPRSVENKSVTT
jgi:hypothetical protein